MEHKRSKFLTPVLFLFSLLLLAIIFLSYTGIKPSFKVDETESKITLPSGFRIEVFAENLGGSAVSIPGPNPGPRMMLFIDKTLFVSVPSQGKVITLPDENKDGKADEVITVIDSLNNPHGIAFYADWLYVAEENEVVRFKLGENLQARKETLEVIVPDLPTGGHFTRTIKIFNNSLYISVGSGCNVCYEEEERRAAITKCDLEGKGCRVFAKGLRNAVGFIFYKDRIWATDNGRDWLGDDAPPDEINIVEEDNNYGWPICYGNNIHDTDFDKSIYIRNPCMEPFEKPSFIDLQAHSAPLGLAFYEGTNFPSEYMGNLFVAFHGSWNSGVPTGYKIVRINTETKEIKDFAIGWLSNNNILGRPVDIVISEEGEMFVSDDNAGKIYRIYYSK